MSTFKASYKWSSDAIGGTKFLTASNFAVACARCSLLSSSDISLASIYLSRALSVAISDMQCTTALLNFKIRYLLLRIKDSRNSSIYCFFSFSSTILSTSGISIWWCSPSRSAFMIAVYQYSKSLNIRSGVLRSRRAFTCSNVSPFLSM